MCFAYGVYMSRRSLRVDDMPTTDKATAAPPAERTPARRPIRYDVLCKFLIAVCFFAYIFIRILRLDVTADELAQEFPLADIFSLERIEEQLQPLVYVFSTVSKDIFPFDEVTELRLPCVLAFVL